MGVDKTKKGKNLSLKGYFCRGTAFILLVVCMLALYGCSKDEPEPEDTGGDDIVEVTPSDTSPEPEIQTVLMGTVIEVDSHLNIRSSPSTSGSILGTAKAGDRFVVKTEFVTEEWHEIEFEGVSAYVHANYLSVKVEKVETE